MIWPNLSRIRHHLWSPLNHILGDCELLIEDHVTAALRERLARSHCFEERGVLSVKGKGEMTTWLLTGRRDRDH